MNENTNLIEETIETVVEEATEEWKFDSKSGLIGGAVTVGIMAIGKFVIVPIGKKLVPKIKSSLDKKKSTDVVDGEYTEVYDEEDE